MKLKKFLIESYVSDVNYNLKNIKNRTKFLKDCISKSYKVELDELDCSISFMRRPTKASVDDIFKISDTKGSFVHYVFIVRGTTFGNDRPYIEAGLSTKLVGTGKEYFIWIYIKLEKLDYFIKKYKLRGGLK